MNYQKFIKDGLLKEEQIGFDQISKVLDRADQNLKSAHILFESEYNEAGLQLAYDAMLLAGRALTFSYGLRPRATGSHKIVVDFTAEVLGSGYETLVKKFDKMRRTRNYLIYGSGLDISDSEAVNAMRTARELIEEIHRVIQEKNPQKKLL